MASTQSKTSTKEPIILLPSVEPDTILRVFDQDFHVHSSMLKIHSQFFRKFLDSSEKASTSTNPAFKYEWITKIDEDGKGWSLVCASSLGAENLEISESIDIKEETYCFQVLLESIYGQPIDIDADQLVRATQLADYYRTLPSLSNNLHRALLENSDFWCSLAENGAQLLEAAYKLRNKFLFKDCMIEVMGPWSNPEFYNIENKELRKLAQLQHHELLETVSECQQDLIKALAKCPSTMASEFRKHETAEIRRQLKRNPNEAIYLPKLYRTLLNIPNLDKNLKMTLDFLTENNLPLRKDAKTGCWPHEDHFLFPDLTHTSVPWDINEKEW